MDPETHVAVWSRRCRRNRTGSAETDNRPPERLAVTVTVWQVLKGFAWYTLPYNNEQHVHTGEDSGRELRRDTGTHPRDRVGFTGTVVGPHSEVKVVGVNSLTAG